MTAATAATSTTTAEEATHELVGHGDVPVATGIGAIDAGASPAGMLSLPVAASDVERDDRFLGALARLFLVGLPPLAILTSSGGVRALPEAALLTTLWLLSFRAIRQTKALPLLKLGIPIRGALGTSIGLGAASFVAFWRPEVTATPRQLLVIAGFIFAFTAVFEAIAWRRLTRRSRVLVVGLGGGGRALVHDLAESPDSRFEIVGVVCFDSETEFSDGMPVLGTTAALHEILISERPDVVVLSTPEHREEVLLSLLDAKTHDFRVVDRHHFYEHAFGRVPVADLAPAWFMSIFHLYQRPYSSVAKRIFDVSIAGAGIAVLAPLFPLVALLVRLSGPGPVLFRQVRLGEGGRTFEMLKFRTMVDGAERSRGPTWAMEEDPRITRVGRVLRKTRLDELPQLWNVMLGDMSVVGPRPERPEFVRLLELEIPYWSRRHLVKPGVTGWAQVRGGYASDVAGSAQKLSFDLYYIKHQSVFLDLVICAETVATMVRGRERVPMPNARPLTG